VEAYLDKDIENQEGSLRVATPDRALGPDNLDLYRKKS